MPLITKKEITKIIASSGDSHVTPAFNEQDKFIGYSVDTEDSYGPDDVDLGPIAIVATSMDENGENTGKVIKISSTIKGNHLIYLRNTELKNSKKVFDVLIDKGFTINTNSKALNHIKNFILMHPTEAYIPYVKRMGYLSLPEIHGYVFPDGFYTKDNVFETILSPDSKTVPSHLLGEYEAWKTQIAAKAVKGKIPAFTLMYSMTNMLLSFSDLGGLFLHLWGDSSLGKSLLLQLAATVYGSGVDPRVDSGSMLQKWNSTSNALLNTAKRFHGSILLLDEVGECSGSEFSDTIYKLTGGVGKSRSKSNGQAQEPDSWSILGISNGEVSALEKIESAKSKQMKGQAIRFLDINIKDQIFSEVPSDTDMKQFVDDLKESCGNHAGHASRDFIQQLLRKSDSKEGLQDLIKKETAKAAEHITCGDHAGQAEKRVLRHFHLIAAAGCYAVEFGILNMTKQSVYAAVNHVKDIWLNGSLDQEATSPESVVRNFIQANKSKFIERNSNKGHETCVGYIDSNGSGNYYLIKLEIFKNLFKENSQSAASQLVKAGFLIRDKDRFARKYQVASKGGSFGSSQELKRFYTIRAEIIDVSEYNSPQLTYAIQLNNEFLTQLSQYNPKLNPNQAIPYFDRIYPQDHAEYHTYAVNLLHKYETTLQKHANKIFNDVKDKQFDFALNDPDQVAQYDYFTQLLNQYSISHQNYDSKLVNEYNENLALRCNSIISKYNYQPQIMQQPQLVQQHPLY